jgi:ABC-type uncharacterized transport system ATPase subunit
MSGLALARPLAGFCVQKQGKIALQGSEIKAKDADFRCALFIP